MLRTVLPSLILLAMQDDAEVVRLVLPEEAEPARAARAVDVERARTILGGDVPAEVVAWSATGAHPMSREASPQWLATVVPIETPLGSAKLAVAALPGERMVARVRIVGLPADKVPAEFLRRFGGFEYSGASLAEPASTLEEARRKAAAASDGESRLLRALLAVRTSMNRISPANMVVVERIQKKQARTAEAESLVALFDEVAAAAEDLSFLREESRRRFRDTSRTSAGQARAVAAALRTGDFGRADEAQQTLNRSCGGCHGSYPALLRRERERLRIGDGYFQVGFDVLPEPGADAKLQEAIAAGVRRALVLLTNSR